MTDDSEHNLWFPLIFVSTHYGLLKYSAAFPAPLLACFPHPLPLLQGVLAARPHQHTDPMSATLPHEVSSHEEMQLT